MKAADIPFRESTKKASERIFRPRGEGCYSLEVEPIGITFFVERLRRDRDGLIGELSVTVNGGMPQARTVDGILSAGDLNFSSVQARNTRAKLLQERGRVDDLDWFGMLEEFTIKTLAAERAGAPAIVLAEATEQAESTETWTVGGLPLLTDLPMVLFGDAAAGKSYLALWLAGLLALDGINVLYTDWEFSQAQHRKRLGQLFHPMPKGVFYVRCESPLAYQADRLLRLIKEHKIQYVICDSIGFAIDGPAEAQESARTYFKALRVLGVGSLNLAHIPKQNADDGREATIFGSKFFLAGARSAWFIERATDNPPHEMRFGVHHRKSNVGSLLASRGYRLKFASDGRATIDSIDVKSVDELASRLPILDRICNYLERNGARSLKQLSEELAVPMPSVRSTVARHRSKFVTLGQKVGIRSAVEDF